MLNPDSERELRNLVETKDIYYVELAHVKELLDEVDRLRKLAYLGEHYFSDLTYKARLEEAIHASQDIARLADAIELGDHGSIND